jgi:hypothetical protein
VYRLLPNNVGNTEEVISFTDGGKLIPPLNYAPWDEDIGRNGL